MLPNFQKGEPGSHESLMMVPLLTAANMEVGIAQQTLLDVPSQHVEDENAFARTSKRIVVYMT